MTRLVVKLPDIGEGTTEAEIVAWHVKAGDAVEEDDPLADVMTDKATVEIPAPVAGRVVAIHGAIGEKRAVGSELVVIETDAAAVPETAAPRREARPAPPASPPPAADSSPPPERKPAPPAAAAPSSQPAGARRPLASPAVRRRAFERGIPLQFVRGTGPEGRITQADLDAYASSAAPVPAAARRDDSVEAVPIVGLRRAIAERLQQSKRQIPHFSYIEEVDVGALEELRAHLNRTREARGHLTLLPFLMRAIVRAVAEHPQVNARFDDEAGILHRHRAVHIGIATQSEAGLLVPVVRHVEALDLWQAAAEISRLAEAARSGKATREELTGSTITITSLGPLGGIAATPVINRPEVAIVGVNRIVERPVIRGGAIVAARVMNLSSSFDHRIVDGWEAASFIQRVKDGLEHPATLFID
jgi:2-oxoisovalerate dehydrogenase E2 component (dihydrolipoyl transacylase)